MEFNKNTNGYSAAQLANGTPSDRVLILKSFFKMTSVPSLLLRILMEGAWDSI
jgi:hypothetical protein